MHDNVTVYTDAFSSGQISSKLWLCRELENLGFNKPKIVWVYGGWYGLASFLLLSREKFPILHIRSFDIDSNCENIADSLLENWVWQSWKFKAVTADCNNIEFNEEKPDLIINCSTEHFDSQEWFTSIPSGTLLALQSNNMTHEDHCFCFDSCDKFAQFYNLDTLYKGTLDFSYPTWKFSRFMIIGTKK
jgi:hypothetical protein